MKHLIALTLALSSIAQAQTYSLPNKAGGEIVLTFDKCHDSRGTDLLDGYSYASDGSMRKLCWAIFDDLVHIVFPDTGSRSVFPPEAFVKKGGKSEKPEQKPKKNYSEI